MNTRIWKLVWIGVGTVFMLYYLLLCLLLWKTRMFHLDTANYLFEILNYKLPFLSPRPASLLTQLIPLGAFHVGAGFTLTAILYSVSFALVYAGITAFTYLRTSALWVIPFFCGLITLTVRDTFFNPVNETTLSVILSGAAYVFSWSWIENNKRNHKWIALIFGILALLSHPVSILLLASAWMILFILKPDSVKRRELVYLLVVPVSYFAIRFLLLPGDQLENQAIVDILSHLGVPNFNNPVLHFFTHHIFTYSMFYLPFCSYTILIIVLLLLEKKYQVATLVTILVFGFMTITAINMRIGESGIVIEKGLLPLSFMILIALPFVWKSGKPARHTILLFAMIIFGLTSFRQIGMRSKVYHQRLEYLVSLNRNYDTPKLILRATQVDMNKIVIPWNTGLETLMYTQVNGGPVCTVYLIPLTQNPEPRWTNDSAIFLGPSYNPVFSESDMNVKLIPLPIGTYTFPEP